MVFSFKYFSFHFLEIGQSCFKNAIYSLISLKIVNILILMPCSVAVVSLLSRVKILAFVEYFIGICQQFHICLLFYVVENRLLPVCTGCLQEGSVELLVFSMRTGVDWAMLLL